LSPALTALCCLTGRKKVAWRHEHEPWPRGCSGCAWFDMAGEPYAVVPDASDGCAVRRLDLEPGEPLAAAPLMAVPAGIHPVHQPGGWVGLSGEKGKTRPGPGGSARRTGPRRVPGSG